MYTGIRDLLGLPAREPSLAHHACQGGASPALPAADVMPVEAVTGSHGARWALGQVLYGDVWAKPCSWSYPRGVFLPV